MKDDIIAPALYTHATQLILLVFEKITHVHSFHIALRN